MKNIAIMLSACVLASCAACSGATSQKASPAGTSTSAPTDSNSVAARFDADSAYAYVARQVEFGPRVPGSDGHAATADWLAAELRRHGADTVIEQRAVMPVAGKDTPIRNIIGRFDAPGKERVLLLAHYDTRPWADAERDPALHSTPIPGANDGASGVGVLLEIARLTGTTANRPVAVDILFVDAEDSGSEADTESWCIGTQYFTRHMPYGDGDRPSYAILLDMVGGRGARFHREQISDRMATAHVQRVWSVAARIGYGDIFVNETGGAVTDDHLFINLAGIPAIDIIENNNAATGSFAPTWHTLSDDIDSIDRRSLRATGHTVMAALGF